MQHMHLCFGTGKSLSEALHFAEHGENMMRTKIVLNVRNNFCTQHVLRRFELGIYCGLVDAKIRASDKDLPVQVSFPKIFACGLVPT